MGGGLRFTSIGVLLTYILLLRPCTSAENIALDKPARQVNEHVWQKDTDVSQGPALAVDGNADQDMEGGSCAKADSDDSSIHQHYYSDPVWWEVNLSAKDSSNSFVIKSVTIFFASCCKGSIIGTYVRTYHSAWVQCARVTTAALVQTVPCVTSVPVKFLQIGHQTLRQLYLCEVRINGYQYKACPAGMWGEGCRLQCECVNKTCNDITGQCEGNIALGKPTRQINKPIWQTDIGLEDGPALAVDGNNDQDMEGGSCAKADSDASSTPEYYRGLPAWWEIDLTAGDSSKSFVIKSVTIHFSNCCQESIFGVSVLGGSGPLFACANIRNHELVQTLTCTMDVPTKNLFIAHKALHRLYICEVVIQGYEYMACPAGMWGEGCTLQCDCASKTCNDITGKCEGNMALGKPAAQYMGDAGEGAELAVDGNAWSCSSQGNLTYSRGDRHDDSSLWWTVDLSAGDNSQSVTINNVTIYFGCCLWRYIVVLVGNTTDIKQQTECARMSGRDDVQTITCSVNSSVTHLSILDKLNKNLHLCEVVVNGHQSQPPTPSPTLSQTTEVAAALTVTSNGGACLSLTKHLLLLLVIILILMQTTACLLQSDLSATTRPSAIT